MEATSQQEKEQDKTGVSRIGTVLVDGETKVRTSTIGEEETRGITVTTKRVVTTIITITITTTMVVEKTMIRMPRVSHLNRLPRMQRTAAAMMQVASRVPATIRYFTVAG